MGTAEQTIHEVGFCSQVASAANQLIAQNPSIYPFIESVDFRQVPSDVVGRIFQKLIGPEERHRYGQHFTGDDVST